MADNVYEGMFILDSGRFGRDPEGVAGQIQSMIKEAGGEILISRLWEERRLAYTIKGQRKGAYWLTYFRLDGTSLAKIHRQCQLSHTILRVLFVKIDPRIVETLVEHAKAGHVSSRREGTGRRSSQTSEKLDENTAAESGAAAENGAAAESGAAAVATVDVANKPPSEADED